MVKETAMNKVYELRDREEFTEVGRTLTDRAGHRTPCLVSSRAFVRNAYPSCSALTSTWMGAGVGQEAVRVLLVSLTRSRDANFLTQACLDASLEYACNVQLVLLSSEFPHSLQDARMHTRQTASSNQQQSAHTHTSSRGYGTTHILIPFLSSTFKFEKKDGDKHLCVFIFLSFAPLRLWGCWR